MSFWDPLYKWLQQQATAAEAWAEQEITKEETAAAKWVKQQESLLITALQHITVSATAVCVVLSLISPERLRPAVPFLALSPLAFDFTRRIMLNQSYLLAVLSLGWAALVYLNE